MSRAINSNIADGRLTTNSTEQRHRGNDQGVENDAQIQSQWETPDYEEMTSLTLTIFSA